MNSGEKTLACFEDEPTHKSSRKLKHTQILMRKQSFHPHLNMVIFIYYLMHNVMMNSAI